MKKIIILSLSMFFFMSGCNANDTNQDEEKYNLYENYKNQLISNSGMLSYNIPFQYKMDVTRLEDGTYSYTIVIDKPEIIMNHVKVMAINMNKDNDNYMIANVGILDDHTYSLVPNQVDQAKGYPKGIALNDISLTADFRVSVIVSFLKDSHTSKDTNIFFNFDVVNGEVVSEVNNE